MSDEPDVRIGHMQRRKSEARVLGHADVTISPLVRILGLCLQRISIRFESHPAVVAGLVPATPSVRAQSKQNRGGRDRPHDPGETTVVQLTGNRCSVMGAGPSRACPAFGTGPSRRD